MPEIIKGSHDGKGLRIAVVSARFNQPVTERLLDGALSALEKAQVMEEDICCFSVAGAVEIPVVARKLALSGKVDAIVALGAVIRGETSHFDYVCSAASDGCMRVACDTGIPVAFGVLTCETGNQALARAAEGTKNKGHEAAMVAIEMANLLKRVDPC